jgi:hypothetical protein
VTWQTEEREDSLRMITGREVVKMADGEKRPRIAID